jgi:hypothetical protein
LYKKDRFFLPLREGNGAVFDPIQDLLRVEGLLALLKSVAMLFAVTAVTWILFLFLPVLLEFAGAISAPWATRNRTVEEIREVCQFVSVPVNPTAKRFRAYRAFPRLTRGSDWPDGALDWGGWPGGNVGLWLGDRVLGVAWLPAFIRL